MIKQRVLFRADGNSEIGLGHISRCCALAEMLKDNFEIHFYTRTDIKNIIEDIKKYGAEVFLLNNEISYDEEAYKWVSVLQGNEIVVLDGYNFNTIYQQQIKNTNCKLVCIDDIHAYHFAADVVINYAPGINANEYSVKPYTKLYLGTDYVLLKKIFLKEATIANKLSSKKSSVLICFGGADPKDITKTVVEKTTQLFPGKIIHVVVGVAYMHLNELKKVTETNDCILLHINIQPEDMLALMKQSGIAITSASTIALEYICVKGNLFLKLTADNQKDLYQSLIKNKCAYTFESLEEKYLSVESAANQYHLIDGKSNQRLVKIFNALSKTLITNALTFVKAQQKDVDLLFSWINDAAVRKQSLSNHIITYTEHKNWFSKKLADKNCYLYIVYKKDKPVGMVRFDMNTNESTISYLVDALQRGKGVGGAIINFGIEQFKKDSRFKGLFIAIVKNVNVASLKIFEKAGFEKESTDTELTRLKKYYSD